MASVIGGKIHIRAAGAVSFVIYQAGNGNYESLTSVQKITIAKAPLTITADNKTKKAGQANPALTATYKGFVNGDDKADLTTQPKLSTTAVTSSKAGTYAITASGAASSNYAITHVAGKLVVSAATIKLNSIDEAPQPLVSQALSPNGDGSNDIFYMRGKGLAAVKNLRIFNRWGEIIFQTNTPGQGWDGNYKGQKQDPGVFVWMCNYQLDGKQIENSSGTFVLIR